PHLLNALGIELDKRAVEQIESGAIHALHQLVADSEYCFIAFEPGVASLAVLLNRLADFERVRLGLRLFVVREKRKPQSRLIEAVIFGIVGLMSHVLFAARIR